MVLAFKLDEFFAPGVCAGNSQRMEGGFGAGICQANFFHTRETLDAFSHADFQRRCPGEQVAAFNGLLHALCHSRVCMA